VFSSLNILGRDHWIDKDELKNFILASQVIIVINLV
jgi:prenyltransferase beta subunit